MGRGLVPGRLGVIVLPLHFGFARVDHAEHRLVKKAMQQYAQDDEVDRLQRYGPPGRMHAQPVYGLAKSKSRATTRQ